MAETMITGTPTKFAKAIKWDAPKVTVYTTEKVIKNYPEVGTEVHLHSTVAEKWVDKGYATAKPVKGEEPAKKAK